MQQNIKIEFIKSVNSIKNKIKQMKHQEHSMNLSLDKVLKPVTDPLKTLVDSNITWEKIKNVENKTLANSEDIESDDINTSTSTNFEDSYNPDLNSAQFIDTPKKKLTDDLEMSLKGDDICGIYEEINIPFGIRSKKKILLMETVNF
ncbi:unnamed protein product [Arctia plantaginis]|uniref:Uncharacterized protein n=1 Tax=Arctia plantaginis TaxID=874455 RepID=A0A8S1AHQ1_ARCPL|nr:unnamed protein product [Arctia plantaginis]